MCQWYGHIHFLRKDATGKKGIHPLERVVAAIRMMAYGVAADSIDGYIQMSEYSGLLPVKSIRQTNCYLSFQVSTSVN